MTSGKILALKNQKKWAKKTCQKVFYVTGS